MAPKAGGIGHETILGTDPADAADGAGIDQAFDFAHGRGEELVVRGHIDNAGFFDRGNDSVGFVEIEAHRFLAEDVLACCCGIKNSRCVQVMRQADIDRVDVGAHRGEHFFPIVKTRRIAAELLGARLQVVFGDVAEGDAFNLILMREDSAGMGARDAAGADEG